jgi:hypothetical protein
MGRPPHSIYSFCRSPGLGDYDDKEVGRIHSSSMCTLATLPLPCDTAVKHSLASFGGFIISARGMKGFSRELTQPAKPDFVIHVW